jgi:hypothetical protein
MSIDEVTKRAYVATPCTARWDEMEGDDKVRYCGQCQLNVFNAAAMTDEEVLDAMVRVTQGKRVCMRLYRRPDGMVLTKNCPAGLKRLQKRARKVAAWIAGGLSLFLSLPALAQSASGNSTTGSGSREKKCASKKPLWQSSIQAAAPSEQHSTKSAGAAPPPVPPTFKPEMMMGDVAYPVDLEARAALTRAELNRVQKAYGPDSLQAAHLLVSLGNILKEQTNYSASYTYLRRAVDNYQRQKQFGQAYNLCETEYQFAHSRSAVPIEPRWTAATNDWAARATYWQKRKAELAKTLTTP